MSSNTVHSSHCTQISAPTAKPDLVFRFVRWHANHHVAGRVGQYELAALSTEHYAKILVFRRGSRSIIRDAVARWVADGECRDVHVAG